MMIATARTMTKKCVLMQLQALVNIFCRRSLVKGNSMREGNSAKDVKKCLMIGDSTIDRIKSVARNFVS